MLKKITEILTYAAIAFLLSLVLSVIYYVLFSLFFSTDTEKRLKEENRVYRDKLPQVEKNVSLLSDELEYLRLRDENIYKCIFKADSPVVDELIGGDILEEEKSDRGNIVKRTNAKSSDAMSVAEGIEDDWRRIFECLNDRGAARPPLMSPIRNLNHTGVGASVGDRLNPFYKVSVSHRGIDLIASPETAVYAAAPGYVSKVKHSTGGEGDVVEITHPGNYVTRYAHLSKILVASGRTVKTGTKIGTVGNSGRSFTTHLHYEVLHNGETMDPAHCFFASLSPEGYLNVLIKSAMSGQSMD